MILLVWDQCGETVLEFYEFMDGTEEANLCKACNGHYMNSSHTDIVTVDALERLDKFLSISTKISIGEGDFGPYSAIYVSGCIP